jgi:3-polyprenyl-4-hydroxybenzoate decarboxylase
MPAHDRPDTQPSGPLAGARVLLAVCGGIAAYKAAELARELMRHGAEVQALLTSSAEAFITRATFAALTGRRVPASVWEDPAAVEHVALARWGEVLVVAPASAHTLARMAAGLADDLVTNVALAFAGPVVVAPAMHTEMWLHPATSRNLEILTDRGVRVVPPASGPLTSGDVGPGRLAELPDLVDGVAAALGRARSLAGVRVLVSLGGTREPLDPVRYIGNRSSGRMGAAIVAEALRRGAEVTAVAAATRVEVPAGARVVRVETAQELYDAVLAAASWRTSTSTWWWSTTSKAPAAPSTPRTPPPTSSTPPGPTSCPAPSPRSPASCSTGSRNCWPAGRPRARRPPGQQVDLGRTDTVSCPRRRQADGGCLPPCRRPGYPSRNPASRRVSKHILEESQWRTATCSRPSR